MNRNCGIPNYYERANNYCVTYEDVFIIENVPWSSFQSWYGLQKTLYESNYFLWPNSIGVIKAIVIDDLSCDIRLWVRQPCSGQLKISNIVYIGENHFNVYHDGFTYARWRPLHHLSIHT